MKSKRILAVICTLTMMLSLCVVAHAETTSTVIPYDNFESYEIDSLLPTGYVQDSWFVQGGSNTGSAIKATERGASACVESDGSGYTEFMRWYITDESCKGLKVHYAIKMEDMNQTHGIILRGNGGELTYASIASDGKVRFGSKTIPSDTFKCVAGKWYDVEIVTNPISGFVYGYITDGINEASAVSSVNPNNTGIYNIDLYTPSGSASKTYYDDIEVYTLDKINEYVGYDDFEEYNTSDKSLTTPPWYCSGSNLEIGFVNHEGGRALKYSVLRNQSYNQIVYYTKAISTAYDLSFDIMLEDFGTPRKILMRNQNDYEINLLQINQDGSFYLANNLHSSYFKFKTGVWYNLNFKYNFADSKVKLIINDGGTEENVFTTDGSGSTGFIGFQFLTTGSGEDSSLSTTYFDNLKIREISYDDEASKLSYATSFDTLNGNIPNETEIASNPFGFYGWRIQNTGEGVNASALGCVEDGRKVMKYTSDNTHHAELIKYMIPLNSDKMAFTSDIKFGDNSGFMYQLRGRKQNGESTSLNTPVYFGNTWIGSTSGDIGQYSYNTWYHMTMVIDRVNHTFDFVLNDINGKTAAEAYGRPFDETLVSIDEIRLYVLPAENKGVTSLYFDNFDAFEVESDSLVVERQAFNGTVGHSGEGLIYAKFNKDIDTSKGTVTANGNPASFVTNGKNIVYFTNLPANTKNCHIEYELYDLVGNKVNGEMYVDTLATYDLSNITLSKDTVLAGEITASVSGGVYDGKSALLLIGVYKDNEKSLVSVGTANVSGIGSFNATANVPNDGKQYSVKAFLWDENLSPILNFAEIK